MPNLNNNQRAFIVNDLGYSSQALYAVNEYIARAATDVGLSAGDFYPGRFAPSSENDNKFVTYFVIPNQVYDLFGLHYDIVDYTFYNSNFDELQRVINVVMKRLNVEDIQTTSLSEPGVIFQETYFAPTGRGQAHFADGVEHYFINAELRLTYTEQ